MITKNQQLMLKIEDMGINGEGIAHCDEQTIFVPFSLPNEIINAQIVFDKKIKMAKVLNIIEPSKFRCSAKCKYFTKCGGCDLQHFNYEQSLKFKTSLVKNTLEKVGQISTDVNDCIASKNIYEYRNKAAFPVVCENGKTKIGMFRKNSHNLIEIDCCPIQKPFANIILEIVNKYVQKYNISGYDEQRKTGILKHIVMREINENVMLTLVVTTPKLDGLEYLSNTLKTNFKFYGLNLNINNLNNNVILSNKNVYVSGLKELSCEENGIKFNVNAMSFFQVNDNVKSKIYEEIFNNIDKDSTVIDAYCGAGLLTAMLAKKCKKVFGIEIIREAVDNANKLFKENSINNALAICGDCSKIFSKLEISTANKINIVLDPPRTGCDLNVLEQILQINAEKIIYLSCSPQTLARDLKILLNSNKYNIKLVQPFDMFPQTKHVETLVILQKKDN